MGVIGVANVEKKYIYNAKSSVFVHSWFRNGQVQACADPEGGEDWLGKG